MNDDPSNIWGVISIVGAIASIASLIYNLLLTRQTKGLRDQAVQLLESKEIGQMGESLNGILKEIQHLESRELGRGANARQTINDHFDRVLSALAQTGSDQPVRQLVEDAQAQFTEGNLMRCRGLVQNANSQLRQRKKTLEYGRLWPKRLT